MCWLSDTAIPQEAKTDIPVFKLCKKDNGNGKVIPYYYHDGFINYREGETYSTRLRPSRNSNGAYEIGNGFHSYSPKCVVDSHSSVSVKVLTPGLEYLDSYYIYQLCLVICTIPKGSIFYVNEAGEYVSGKIHIVRHINLPQDDGWACAEIISRSLKKLNK